MEGIENGHRMSASVSRPAAGSERVRMTTREDEREMREGTTIIPQRP